MTPTKTKAVRKTGKLVPMTKDKGFEARLDRIERDHDFMESIRAQEAEITEHERAIIELEDEIDDRFIGRYGKGEGK